MGNADVDRYFEVAARRFRHNEGNRRFWYQRVFSGLDFAGRTVLDIGAGDGSASFYAAACGASRVIALEPEADGSRPGMVADFEQLRDELGADRVELRGESFQDFHPDGIKFDVVLSISSINHLDEEACSRLAEDEAARDVYRSLFGKLAEMSLHGADLVVEDSARRNLFGDLRIRNPLAPTIEWHKHQPPRLWAQLLEEQGFGSARVQWNSLNTLRRPGQMLLANRVGAYLLTSEFHLRMKRRTGGSRTSTRGAAPRPATAGR